MALPDRSWPSYEEALRRLAERRARSGDAKQLRFLRELKFANPDLSAVTETGAAYFEARFISEDFGLATRVLAAALTDYPPSAVVAQLLYGVSNASRDKAESILRHFAVAPDLSDPKLTALLSIMHAADLVEYEQKSGNLRVLAAPAAAARTPASVFVSPETPYGNKAWLRRILAECQGQISWLDKHFMPVAFDAIWEAVDGTRVQSVRVLSLRLPEHEGRRPIRAYRDLVAELSNRGARLAWHTVDSNLVKTTHDRWIVSDDGARNVPNVNAIFSGQHSEMTASSNRLELQPIFEKYWGLSRPFDQQGGGAGSGGD